MVKASDALQGTAACACALLVACAIALAPSMGVQPAYADDETAESTEIAEGESTDDSETTDADSDAADSDEAASEEEDEEDADTTTEGSVNTGVTEYNEEGDEVTDGIVSSDDDRNARIAVGVLLALVGVALVVALVWYVRTYRPRRAVERAAAQAAAPAGDSGKVHPALAGGVHRKSRFGRRKRASAAPNGR